MLPPSDEPDSPIASPGHQSITSDIDSLLSQSLSGLELDSDQEDSDDEELDLESDTDIDDRGYVKILEENACTGQHIEWSAGSVWSTYAYAQHEDGDGVDWTPIGFDGSDCIRLRADDCKIILQTPEEINIRACIKCHRLLNSPKLRRFMERAQGNALHHTPYKYLTAVQMRQALYEARKQMVQYRVQVAPYSFNANNNLN